ncbi:MAG: hypothetical protein [Chaetfec virus UA24_144]|nr:MAG: hypothetical protein [Chaetfec virus UA24_144]
MKKNTYTSCSVPPRSGLYLQHYGVKGMKWGVRKQRKKSSDYSEAKRLKKKRSSELSNQELRKLNERMRLENEYNSLKSQRSVINRGHKIAQKTVAYAGTATALYGLSKKALNSKAGKAAISRGKKALVHAYAAGQIYKSRSGR